jgi:hypothetical protein
MSKIDFSRMITFEERKTEERRQAASLEIVEASAVLGATDWQVIREAEGGNPMTEDIRESRAKARDLISRLRAELATLPPEP